MNQEQTIQYNANCSKFLGAIVEQWYPPNKDTKSSGVYYAMPYGKFFPNKERYCGESFLKFHSDWNWIMVVKDEVCKLSLVDEFNVSFDSVSKGYYCSITPGFKNTFNTFYTKTYNTEKEAIVEVINQFLIWYNNEKNN